jgi:hypothetical protein
MKWVGVLNTGWDGLNSDIPAKHPSSGGSIKYLIHHRAIWHEMQLYFSTIGVDKMVLGVTGLDAPELW